MNTNQSYLQLMDIPANQYFVASQKRVISRELVELPAIDGDVLEKLRTDLAQIAPELLAELIHYYLTNTPGLLAKLRQAVDQADANTLNITAHKLKSNSARLGAMICSTLCQELEVMGQTGNLQDAAEKLVELEEEYERARMAFAMME